MKLKSITLNNFKGMDNIEFLKQLIYYMPILLQN